MWEIIKKDPVAYILIAIAAVSYVGAFLCMARIIWLVGEVLSDADSAIRDSRAARGEEDS